MIAKYNPKVGGLYFFSAAGALAVAVALALAVAAKSP